MQMLKGNGSRFTRIFLFVAVILLIIVLFVFFVDWAVVWRQVQTAVPGYLLLSFALLLAGMWAYAIRWRVLLADRPPRLATFHASNIGHAGNIVIPARAGEALRIVVMGRNTPVSITAATSSFVVERLFEQVMRLLALGAAVAVGVGLTVTPGAVLGGLGMVALAAAGLAWLLRRRETVLARWPQRLARLPRVSEAGARAALADLLDNLTAVSDSRQLLRVTFWSLAAWGLFWGFFYAVLLALGETFAPAQRLSVSLGALALSPPSAPTQPGIFHASVVAPLTAVGFTAEPLTAYAVLLHLLEMVGMIGLALWGLWHTGLSPRALLGAQR